MAEQAMAGARDGDRALLRHAIELAERCPPGETFAVGAVITDAAGAVLATGYSRERDAKDHAEEVALAKLTAGAAPATIYSSLEPCSRRASRPSSCTELILGTAIHRIVFAWREPLLFVDCDGAEQLARAGRQVIELDELAHLVRQTNAHLPGIAPPPGVAPPPGGQPPPNSAPPAGSEPRPGEPG